MNASTSVSPGMGAGDLRDPTWLRVRIGTEDLRSVASATAFFVASVALLTYDHTTVGLFEPVYWGALALIVVVFAWLLARIGATSTMAAALRRESRRDPITGLGNEISLGDDLNAALEARDESVLFILELDSGAGEDFEDELSRELMLTAGATELTDVAAALSARAYRVEGSLFALLAPASHGSHADVIVRARAAVAQPGQNTLDTSRLAYVGLPVADGSSDGVLQLATERLVVNKRNDRRSARRQAHAALVTALNELDPELRRRLRAIVPRVIAVGRRMGLGRVELDDVVLAVGLRDVGVLAVPDRPLSLVTSGPAGEEQLGTRAIAGERIVASAPSLVPVAKLVRSAHERFDGTGWPDRLCGEEIPVGARIIAPCVALAAMTSSGAMTEQEALGALRDEAGRRFDPEVVEALAGNVAEEARGRETEWDRQAVASA